MSDLRLWATWARYAYRSREFQVRLPLGSAPRAEAVVALARTGGRVEHGTAVFGGEAALDVMARLLGAPRGLVDAGWAVVNADPTLRRGAWGEFVLTLGDAMAYDAVHAPAEAAPPAD